MLVYFDTSALIPLLIDEPSTARCRAAWHSADSIATAAISYVEVHAAVSHATRRHRLTDDAQRRVLASFEQLWADIIQVQLDADVIRVAARLADEHALRGYDAVQCATALMVAVDDFVAIAGDRDLLRAWSDLGIATIDASG